MKLSNFFLSIKYLNHSHHCLLFVAEWVVLLVLHLLMIVIVFSNISWVLTIHVIVIHLLLGLSDHILLHFLRLRHLTCFHVVFGDLLTLVILTRLFFLHGL